MLRAVGRSGDDADDRVVTTLVASSFASCLVLMSALSALYKVTMKECLRIACVALALRRAKARSVSPLANGSDYPDRVFVVY